MTDQKALIIGGTGQIGVAAAEELARHGWQVTVASRRAADLLPSWAELGIRTAALDRADTGALRAAAAENDLVVDVVAFTPGHAEQLTGLAGTVGSVVVISTGAVYAPLPGSDDASPRFPMPLTEDSPTRPDGGGDYGSNKATLERALLAADDLPVSILRPGTLHGPRSTSLHQWSFIKPALDKRPHVVLAQDGQSRFGSSSTRNIAHLIRLCAEQPGRRVLNVADDEQLTTAEIARRIFAVMGVDIEIVTFSGPSRLDGLGFNPWNVPHPVVFSMDRARRELGYQPAISYDDALRIDIDWAVDVVDAAEQDGRSWMDVFPGLIERFGSAPWFPYEAEDRYVDGR